MAGFTAGGVHWHTMNGLKVVHGSFSDNSDALASTYDTFDGAVGTPQPGGFSYEVEVPVMGANPHDAQLALQTLTGVSGVLTGTDKVSGATVTQNVLISGRRESYRAKQVATITFTLVGLGTPARLLA